MPDAATPPAAPRTRRSLGRSARIVLTIFAVIASAIAADLAYGAWRVRGPDLGFERITGVKLPPGIIPVAHTTRITDNFFHESHFWLLDGRRDEFRALAGAAGLEPSDEDAKWGVRADLFGAQPPEFLEGYEGSPDGGRDRWLFVFHPGSRAVFEY